MAMVSKSNVVSCCSWCFLSVALAALLTSLTVRAEGYDEEPGTQGNGNVVVGPEYNKDPDLTDRGNPKGKSFEFSMRLSESKIFPGNDRTLDPKKPVRQQRKIFVYVPASYKDGSKA